MQARVMLTSVLTRTPTLATALAAAVLLAAAAAACNAERRYAGEPLVHQVALTEATPPALALADAELFVVEERIELELTAPTEVALEDLRVAAEGFAGLPFPRVPWIARDDLAIQVDFVLVNLDDVAHDVAVVANGFNEFDEYVPGVTVIDDDPVVDYAQWERLYRLEPEQRLARTIREEDFDEAAVDLATVVNGAPSSNQVVYFENHSSTDPLAAPYIPEVIPGLVGFRLGLRATEPGNVLLEATVRVRDVGEVLVEEGDAPFVAMPEPFTPVAPEL